MSDLDVHVSYLRTFLASKWEYMAGVKDLLAYGRSVAPDAPWSALDGLDLKREARSFEVWISSHLDAANSAEGVRGFYFGVSEDGTAVHLDGTPEFDAGDQDGDWACSWVFRSDDDWAESLALEGFAEISEKADGDIPVLLYVLCLGFVGLLVQRHAAGLNQPVAVGFDDGDVYVLPA